MSSLTPDDPPLCPHSVKMTPLYVLTFDLKKCHRHTHRPSHNYMITDHTDFKPKTDRRINNSGQVLRAKCTGPNLRVTHM